MKKGDACYVAVLGTGSIGTRHLDVLRKLDVTPLAIPIRQERITELQTAGFEVARNLEEAADLGTQLCIVATDSGRHFQDTVFAMDRGFDVLVEKPLTLNASEAASLNARADERGRALFVGCVLRFSESLNTFRGLLSRIGQIHSVRIECRSYLPDWRPARPYQNSYSARRGEGGVLRDLIHEIDYAGWLFGWPETLAASVRNLGRLGIETDEIAELMWETAAGSIISIGLDYLTRPSLRKMHALGEWGSLEWDGVKQTVTLTLAGSESKIIPSAQSRDQMFISQDLAFLKAVAGDRDERLATGQDGLKGLAVCDAARLAASRHAKEKIAL